MKKFILFVFSLIIGLAVFCGLYVKADSVITMTNGASVRTTGTYQGLRFEASVDTLEGSTEHGFFLALGEHSFSDMQTAINAKASTIGGNKLVKKAAEGTDESFAVTIYGIGNTNYVSDITAVAYVYNGSSYTLDKAVTRNIAEVALNALNDNVEGTILDDVATYIAGNYKKAYENYAGNFVVNNAAYCYKPEELAVVFVKDWNNFVTSSDRIDSITANTKATSASLSYKSKIGADFYYSAKNTKWEDLASGEAGVTDISSSNLYAFFHDTKMSEKWGWLLDLLYAADNTSHTKYQIDAIKGDGTNYNTSESKYRPLYSCQHVILSILGFFTKTKQSYYYNGIDFSNGSSRQSYYENMLSGSGTNTTVYNPSFGSTQIGKVGDTVTLPAAKTPDEGYNWDGYYAGLTKYNANASYTLTSGNVSFIPTFEAITYTVTYMDGSTDISSLFASSYKSFTIESSALTLPIYEKDGFLFEGWYDNAGLTGSAITTIPEGSHENKVFYAKTTAGDSVNITFAMNDGSGNTDVSIKVKGDTITNVPVKGAYIFNGWFDNAECTGSAVTIVPNTDTTLYAKWTAMTVSDIQNKFLADVNASAITNSIINAEITSDQFYTNFVGKFMNVTGSAVAGVYPKDGLMARDSDLLAKYGWLLEYIGHIMGNKKYGNTSLVAFGLQSENDSNLVSSSLDYCDKTITNSVHNFLNGTGNILHGGSSSGAVPADFSVANSYDDLLAAAAAANFSYAKYN